MSYSDMFGWYNNIQDDYKELSPFHGFVAFETGFIKNLYLLGNLEYTGNLGERNVNITGGDSTIKLVHNLFHLVINEFGITILPSSPATYLDAQAIAAILKNFHRPTSEKTLEESITKAIQNSILRDEQKTNNPTISATDINTLIETARPHIQIINSSTNLTIESIIKALKQQDVKVINRMIKRESKNLPRQQAYEKLRLQLFERKNSPPETEASARSHEKKINPPEDAEVFD